MGKLALTAQSLTHANCSRAFICLQGIARSVGFSISDEEPDSDQDEDYSACQLARALYDFDGKVEFRELSVQAGDDFDVVKEELVVCWSLGQERWACCLVRIMR